MPLAKKLSFCDIPIDEYYLITIDIEGCCFCARAMLLTNSLMVGQHFFSKKKGGEGA